MLPTRGMTVSQLLEVRGWCNVCSGRSPHWDGHDQDPPCQGAAREEIVRRARVYDDAHFGNPVVGKHVRKDKVDRDNSV
jgi:hypothetical protein